jgi:regulatory protein
MDPEDGERVEAGVITGIEPQQRRRERVSLFLDGEFALGVHAEVALACGWRVGQRVTVEELRAVAHREELRRARDAALRLLGVRARSRAELAARLARKGYEPEVVEPTLVALAGAGLLDDEAFAQAWVRRRVGGRGLGRQRVAAELRAKGVDRETAAEALGELTEDVEYAQALEWAANRAAALEGEEPHDRRRKLSAALARRGYNWDICARVLEALGLGR